MVDGVNTEAQRILQLIADRQISAAEGEALLDALEGRAQVRCPWCAEEIPGGREVCPECGEAIGRAPAPAPQVQGLMHGLSTLDQVLAVTVILISGIYLLSHHAFFSQGVAMLLAILGIVSGVLILKRNPLGWTLGIIWSAAQIIEFILAGHAINRQLFHLGGTFQSNGAGLGINLVGVLFLILFIKASNQRKAAR
jgi:hypothetical protein